MRNPNSLRLLRHGGRAARRAGPAVLLIALLCAACGCVGYTVGSSLPGSIRSIHVPTFVNRSGEPDIESALTSAAMREFQRDGTLRLSPERDADVELETVIAGFETKPLRYSSEKRTQTTEYRLVITANIVCKERRGTNSVLVSVDGLRGEATFELVGDLAASKQTALPAAARDLAHKIVESVVEAW